MTRWLHDYRLAVKMVEPTRSTEETNVPNIDELLARVEAMRRLPPPDQRRLLRMTAGLTRDELASQLGVTSSALYLWETGRADPGKDSIEAYVALLERLQAEIDARGEG